MLRPIAIAVWASLGLVVAACGSPPPPPSPPGTLLEVHLVGTRGPRIASGAIFAASDLITLRALIDAMSFR